MNAIHNDVIFTVILQHKNDDSLHYNNKLYSLLDRSTNIHSVLPACLGITKEKE